MQRRWLRWVTRIGLGLLAILAAGVAVLFFLNPEATLLLFAILINPIVSNTRPPAIVADELVGASWQKRGEINRNIDALFQRKFPEGTSEEILRSALLREGFKPLPPPPANCIPREQEQAQPVGRVYVICPTGDRSRILEYQWGSVVCSSTITVRWAVSDRRELTKVNAGYDVGCL